jgi:hypothetical protein
MTTGRNELGERWVISYSGQLWKVSIGLLLLVGGAVTHAGFSFSPQLRALISIPERYYNVLALSALAAAVGFVVLCVTVRCPVCSAKWIWMAVNGKLGRGSLDALVTLTRCPKCGYPSK